MKLKDLLKVLKSDSDRKINFSIWEGEERGYNEQEGILDEDQKAVILNPYGNTSYFYLDRYEDFFITDIINENDFLRITLNDGNEWEEEEPKTEENEEVKDLEIIDLLKRSLHCLLVNECDKIEYFINDATDTKKIESWEEIISKNLYNDLLSKIGKCATVEAERLQNDFRNLEADREDFKTFLTENKNLLDHNEKQGYLFDYLERKDMLNWFTPSEINKFTDMLIYDNDLLLCWSTDYLREVEGCHEETDKAKAQLENLDSIIADIIINHMKERLNYNENN